MIVENLKIFLLSYKKDHDRFGFWKPDLTCN